MHSSLVILVLVGLTTGQMLLSPHSRDCRELGNAGTGPTEKQSLPLYMSGEVMVVKVDLPVMKGGFEFYLCPEADQQDEECLAKLPLEMVGDLGKQFDMGEITTASQYEIPLQLPEGITCDTCTLQWILNLDECDENDETQCLSLRDTMCADISIQTPIARDRRGWDFLKGALNHAVHGAAQNLVKCG